MAVDPNDVGIVLAVDDQRENRELVEAVLGDEGYLIDTANDGVAALEQIGRRRPDCIVLDVMMPRMDGLMMTRLMKGDRRLRNIPILLLTALSEIDDKVRGLESGADDFLNKPVDRHELIARVRSLVKIKRLHDELDTSENIIYSMERALDNKHALLHGHSERVAISALTLAKALHLPSEDVDTVGKAAFLHDLGKIGVPEELITADAEMSREDTKVYARHPEIGDTILAPLRRFGTIRKIIRGHHERLDGSGFPDGLKGEAFTLPMEIVALANHFEEVCARASQEEAASVLRGAAARGQFRRETVEAFLKQPRVSHEMMSKGWEALLPPPPQQARKGKILIADDLPANREVLAEILLEAGHDVISVGGGNEVFEVLEREKPDLLIVDVRMPDLDGFSVCQRIKQRPDTEFLPVILITAMRDTLNRRHGMSLGADDFIISPVNKLELRARVNSLLRMRQYYVDLEDHQSVILSLATALEAKHAYTRGHSERVGHLAFQLAQSLGMSARDCDNLRVAGMLHDIGKIGISERVLNKPGRLTDAEFQQVMTHPPRGEGICRPLQAVQAALPYIRHHHERKGYPDHLVGEAIPLGARVLALADAYDALTSERSYRKTLSPVEAMEILSKETTEGLWDPTIFSALKTIMAQGGVL
jgi:putative two-component system response regulator